VLWEGCDDLRQYRYGLSFWDVEDLLADRGVLVSYETIR
jgi:transposase-like protein